MMATYFNGGSEIQSDNLQTLFLMNRGGYAANFSDGAPQPPPGVLLLNHPAPNNLPPGPTHHNHNHHHHLLGIPLAGEDPSAAGPRFHYNLWGGGGGEPHIPTAIAINGGELGSPMGFRRPAPVTTAVIDHQQLQHHHQQQQQQGGLSLSLNNSSPHKNVAGTMTILSPGSGTPTSTASAVTTGVAGCGSPGLIMRSKYLKAAQQLLDEVVNVGKAMDSRGKEKTAVGIGIGEGSSSGGGGSGGGGESGGAKGGAVELTTAQRQELQMKKAKLLNMLDEVEQRYRQYHSQMQMVAASFEQAAGGGSAKTYTALALQTISKQFRCLRDAIGEQIRAVGRSMGEEEEAEEEGKGRSRLRMVDHQLRQQRALQQLGMMHHNAWRPQRGLPERAVSVLRAWLFEHFLHPYPKDSDKHMLAKQTGLTRSQVSNWFINARVRLWKPMVEEMYVEEMKSNEQNGSENNNIVHTSTTKDHNQDSTISSKSSTPRHSSRPAHHPIIDKPNHNYNQNPHHDLLPPPPPNDVTTNGSTLHSVGPLPSFSLVGPSEMDPMSPKRQRMMIPSDAISSPMDKEMKPVGRDLFPPDLGGFGSYPIGEIGSRYNPAHHPHHQLGHQHQYHHGNTVSLTLGLPHDSDQSLSLAGNHHHHHQQQNFLHGHQAMHSTDAGGGYDFVT